MHPEHARRAKRLHVDGGRRGAALLIAIQHQGSLYETVCPAISRLSLEILSGVTRTRVETAANAAIRAGLVRCHPSQAEGWRTKWEVNLPKLRAQVAANGGGCSGVPRPIRNHPALLLWQDVWDERALGLAGWRLYVAVLHLGSSDAETIAQAVGGNPRVVRSRLRRLEAADLVRHELGQWLPTGIRPEEAAEQQGWVGLAERRELHTLANHGERNVWDDGMRDAVAKVDRARTLRAAAGG